MQILSTNVDALSILAPVSAFLVMLNLGLKTPVFPKGIWAQHGLAFALGHYALPLLALYLMYHWTWLSLAGFAGLSVCMLSGIGTSAVPMALRNGTRPEALSGRLVLSSGIALVTVPVFTVWVHPPEHPSLQIALVFGVLMGVVWLPWQVGRMASHRQALSPVTCRWIERTGNWTVIALVSVVAWRELPKLPEQPELVLACGLLTAVLSAGGLVLDRKNGMISTAIVRNLTLTILVLTNWDIGPEALTALSAYGVLMYMAVWPAIRLGRTLQNS